MEKAANVGIRTLGRDFGLTEYVGYAERSSRLCRVDQERA
jgi:hypothetical protein